MDYSMFENCSLFAGIPAKDLRTDFEAVPHLMQFYEKGETVFQMMEPASRVGLVLSGCVEAVKPFPNGSQVNVSMRKAGDLIGQAAAFSQFPFYPCEVAAAEPAAVMMFKSDDILSLMQKDARILRNFLSQIATATYMLQEKLELLSYNGIAQKAAYYLLLQEKKTGRRDISIPKSVSNWAEVLNVSRPSLHRELKKLETAEIISYKPPLIRILDEDALEKVLG